MALDNPSYFTVNTEPIGNEFLKKSPKTSDTASTSSESSLKQLNLPLPFKFARGYLRSVSTNSADSNQELLIMGEPRLSDIAPDLTYKLPPEPRRSNSLKFTRTDKKCLYSSLPTSEINDDIDQDEDEEVFLAENIATYSNLSVTRRRHSIGTVMARERTASSPSFKEDPHVVIHATPDGNAIPSNNSSFAFDDHSMRHSSYPRKRCVRCKVPNKKLSDMEDILIVSVRDSEAATMWANYFGSCFQQFGNIYQATKKAFKIHHLSVEEIIEANGDIRFISEKTAGVKLQLLVICPLFLDKIAKNLSKTSPLSKLLIPNRVLALLLGVTDNDITETHKNVLTTFSQWQRYAVGEDEDETFTKEFLSAAVTIFMKILKQQISVSNQEKSHFSVLPKKVRQGQNSVLIILTHPLQKEDIVKISIERNNEMIELKSMKIRNPYTIKIAIPESMTEVSAIVNVLVEKNGNIIGTRPLKCESKLRELEQILRTTANPIEFMCQTLGFTAHDKAQLDNFMVHTFQKNLPSNFNLLTHTAPMDRLKSIACEEFPTLLHFAAKYGLEKFAIQLVECPGGDTACELKNVNDRNPSDIAECEGFSELAQMLRGYMKMNEFTKIYTKLKQIQLNPECIEDNDDEYLVPREISADFYKVCPAPKPVLTPTTPNSEVSYLPMTTKQNLSTETPTKDKTNSLPRITSASSTSNISTTSQKSAAISFTGEDKVQTELFEILRDVTLNIHTYEQAEKLVEEWKNRNDVQKSFKEKAEQLNDMRRWYDKLQHDMKQGNKVSTFDRVKNLFLRKKKDPNSKSVEKEIFSVLPNTNRPISSLSLQSTSSSGSSGRMSTISACSLGDSGTHSDHEDRKNLLTSSLDEEFRPLDIIKEMKEVNYMIPPSPKPVIQTKLNLQLQNTIDVRPPQPIPRGSLEHYIQYPPSGLPVQALSNVNESPEDNVYIEFEDQSSPTSEYMNLPLNIQKSQNREYMNFSSPISNQNFGEYMNYKPGKK
nr:uncharacterized protein LOC111417055 isoform X1 [Onthophagus taurus]XP_022904989.1 uncharacterized protein LOC111417055 isoform X1 [Onthophagus taurus]